jgi:hypothetical protein
MKAHELIAKPENWTQGTCARTKEGNPTDTLNENAYSFCIIGALIKCYGGDSPECFQNIEMALDKLTEKPAYLSAWNDNINTTHEQVYKLLKELDI